MTTSERALIYLREDRSPGLVAIRSASRSSRPPSRVWSPSPGASDEVPRPNRTAGPPGREANAPDPRPATPLAPDALPSAATLPGD
jgi:hypothetical protein